jgi:hypothetical protein
MPAKSRTAGGLIGCARVSTEEQGTDPQLDELRAAGCATILQEHVRRFPQPAGEPKVNEKAFHDRAGRAGDGRQCSSGRRAGRENAQP